jgi:NTP pyrophosphatase (non-canonical NTP hydrolase)
MRGNRALRRDTAPNVFEAFRQVVYAYGVEAMASAIGQRPGTLYNKADAGDDTHNQPTLRDVLLVTRISGDMAVLDALDETFGRAAYDAAQHANTSDEALLELMANLGAESGEFHRAIAEGLRARSFSPEAMRHIRGEAFDLISAVMVLVHRIEGLVDEGQGDGR